MTDSGSLLANRCFPTPDPNAPVGRVKTLDVKERLPPPTPMVLTKSLEMMEEAVLRSN